MPLLALAVLESNGAIQVVERIVRDPAGPVAKTARGELIALDTMPAVRSCHTDDCDENAGCAREIGDDELTRSSLSGDKQIVRRSPPTLTLFLFCSSQDLTCGMGYGESRGGNQCEESCDADAYGSPCDDSASRILQSLQCAGQVPRIDEAAQRGCRGGKTNDGRSDIGPLPSIQSVFYGMG
jgi:hypothetical protein